MRSLVFTDVGAGEDRPDLDFLAGLSSALKDGHPDPAAQILHLLAGR